MVKPALVLLIQNEITKELGELKVDLTVNNLTKVERQRRRKMLEILNEQMKVYIVLTDACPECGCWSESIDSIWANEKDAKKRAKEKYNGKFRCYEVKDVTQIE